MHDKNEAIASAEKYYRSLAAENHALRMELQARNQKGVGNEEALLHELQVGPGPGPADGADEAADADAEADLQQTLTSWRCWQMQEGEKR